MIYDRNLNDGTVLVARYHRDTYRCTVHLSNMSRRSYEVLGRFFRSPSAAGRAITGTACNGWRFWSVEGGEAIEAIARNRSERRHLITSADRKFGVEIEYVGPTHNQLAEALRRHGLIAQTENYGHTRHAYWKVTDDGSVRAHGRNADGTYQHTGELVSPPLKGADGFEQLRKACDALRETGATVNRTCGLHVHHDAADFTVATFRNILRGYAQNQSNIDGLVSPSRRSQMRQTYCRPIDPTYVTMLERAAEMDTGSRDMRRTMFNNWGRYYALNLNAYPRHGTVEFRQHQGTVEYAKIAAWVKFGKAMIDAAQNAITVASTLTDFLGILPLDNDTRSYLAGRGERLAA